MYQETNTSNSNKRSDLMLFFGLVLLLILARFLLSLIQAVGGGAMQLIVFVLLGAICFLVYKKRFCTYRYTLFNKEPEEGELDEYGNQATLPLPLGTFIIEQLSGSRGGVVANIAPGDMLSLIVPPAGLPSEAQDSHSSLKKPPLYGNGKREQAHILLYRDNGVKKALAFCPSEELAAMLKEIIDAVNA